MGPLHPTGGLPILCQSTYWMCLCIGNSQLHISIKHETNGEPYNCGEGTLGYLINGGAGLLIFGKSAYPPRGLLEPPRLLILAA